MKKVIALVVAFAAVAIVAGSEANAQNFSFNNGFQFGAGARSAAVGNPGLGFGFGSGFGQFGRGFSSRQVRPPYFAEFPPVYYNGIVRRPYGISPFAAPAGVVPVELTRAAGPVEPAVVSNPFFRKNKSTSASVLEKVEKPTSTKNKSARVINRFFGTDQEVVGSILHASFDVQGN